MNLDRQFRIRFDPNSPMKRILGRNISRNEINRNGGENSLADRLNVVEAGGFNCLLTSNSVSCW